MNNNSVITNNRVYPIIAAVLAVLAASLLTACGESLSTEQLPFACRRDTGTTLVQLSKVADTSVYTATVEDPLFACLSREAVITSVDNTSGYSIALVRSDTMTPTLEIPADAMLLTGGSADNFKDAKVKGLWQAQYGGGVGDAPPPAQISIEINWRKP
jgi:hypothetical protein